MNSYTFDQNRVAWANVAYKPGSTIACLPPSDASIKRIYHLTTAEYAISNIALERLKVARFSDLNDPFELIAANFREREVRKIVRGFKSAFDAQTGLLCFSEDWIDPLQWSHYAERHRGICLGFDVPRDCIEKVRYKEARIAVELGAEGDSLMLTPEITRELRCTKYSHWSYEREYRKFVPLESAVAQSRLHFVPFSSDLKLVEVILGTECALDLHAVRDLVKSKHPNAVVFRARLEFKGFHIVPQESSIPVTGSANWDETSA